MGETSLTGAMAAVKSRRFQHIVMLRSPPQVDDEASGVESGYVNRDQVPSTTPDPSSAAADSG